MLYKEVKAMPEKWEKPELVILVRGHSEEVLTSGCKTVGIMIGPSSNSNGCGDVLSTNCGSCQGRGGGAS